MDKETETKIDILREMVKLPVDKATNTIKLRDVTDLIEKITRTIPQKQKNEFVRGK